MKSPKLTKEITVDVFEKITLREPYSCDFGSHGWLHPRHKNECLVYDQHHKIWAILDCYGDVYSFPTLEDALKEFDSEEGHLTWLASKEFWKSDFYFATTLPFFKCILDYPDETLFRIDFNDNFLGETDQSEKLHIVLRSAFLDNLKGKGYSVLLLNNRQIGVEHPNSTENQFKSDSRTALCDAISFFTGKYIQDNTGICSLEVIPLKQLSSNPTPQEIIRCFHADDMRSLPPNSFMVPVLMPSRYTNNEEVIGLLTSSGTIKIASHGNIPNPPSGKNKSQSRSKKKKNFSAKGFSKQS